MTPNPDFDPLKLLEQTHQVTKDTALNMVKLSAWMIEASQELTRLRQAQTGHLAMIEQLIELNRILDARLQRLENPQKSSINKHSLIDNTPAGS